MAGCGEPRQRSGGQGHRQGAPCPPPMPFGDEGERQQPAQRKEERGCRGAGRWTGGQPQEREEPPRAGSVDARSTAGDRELHREREHQGRGGYGRHTGEQQPAEGVPSAPPPRRSPSARPGVSEEPGGTRSPPPADPARPSAFPTGPGSPASERSRPIAAQAPDSLRPLRRTPSISKRPRTRGGTRAGRRGTRGTRPPRFAGRTGPPGTPAARGAPPPVGPPRRDGRRPETGPVAGAAGSRAPRPPPHGHRLGPPAPTRPGGPIAGVPFRPEP